MGLLSAPYAERDFSEGIAITSARTAAQEWTVEQERRSMATYKIIINDHEQISGEFSDIDEIYIWYLKKGECKQRISIKLREDDE